MQQLNVARSDIDGADRQTRRRHGRTVFFVALAAGAVFAADSPADAQGRRPTQPEAVSSNEPVFRVTRQNSKTQIVERFSKIVQFEPRIKRVDGFDPSVIDVTALDANQLRVQALIPGVTTMVVVDESGDVFSIEVFVVGDVRHLQAYISRMFPNAAVEAVKVQDSVVLRGWVTRPEQITQIVEIAETFFPRVLNQMQVGGVQQVALKVKVLEVQRSKIRQLGFNFLHVSEDAFLTSTPGQLVQVAEILAPFGGPPGVTFAQSTLRDSQFIGGVVGDNNVFLGFLEALKQEGLLKILAEPELVATNGRPANLLAGGEFPILVPQSLGTVTIEWREFGVRLQAVPNVLSRGRVRLELEPEVSERDFSQAVTINGITVPGITTRRANTQVEMNFGETFVIAGLLSTRNTAETFKIPILGEAPWIGAAFRRVRYDEAETELVIMVTPELVAPLAADQCPPLGPGQFSDTPTDRELFIDGVLEVPYYGDRCSQCGNGCAPGGACSQCDQGGRDTIDGPYPRPGAPMLPPGTIPPGPEPMAPSSPPAAPGPSVRYDQPPATHPIWTPAPTIPNLEDAESFDSSSAPSNPFAPSGPDATRPDRGWGPTVPESRPQPRAGLIEPQSGLIEPVSGWYPTGSSR